MAITTLDQLLAAPRQMLPIFKVSATSKAIGALHSTWLTNGAYGPGSAPGVVAGVVPTSATAGAIKFVNPVSGETTIDKLSLAVSTIGMVTLYDRLLHSSGLSGTVTAAQTVNSTALTRETTGEGVELYLEWYTATGSTAVNVTASYTNSDGTAGRTTSSVQIVASPVAGMMLRLPLAAGDKGVRSVQSVTLSATTGTAGNFGITLVKRLADVPNPVINVGTTLDIFQLGKPIIQNDACLALMVTCSATNTGNISGSISLAQG